MKDPDAVKGHLAALNHSRKNGETLNALRAADALRRLEPTNRKILSVLLELRVEMRNWTHAILECQRLAILKPDTATDWLQIATIAPRLSQHSRGVQYAKRAFITDPNLQESQLIYAGMLLDQSKDGQDTIDEVDRILENTAIANSYSARIRARARHETGRTREAVQVINEFLEEGEPNANLLSDWATYLAGTGRFADARRAFLASAALHCGDAAKLLDSTAQTASLAKRIPSPVGVELPELDVHRREIRTNAKFHLIVFVRHFIDLDHFTPVIAEWVQRSGFFASVVKADVDLPESDFRARFLASCPRLRIFRLGDLAPTGGTDMIFEDIARRMIVEGPKTVACADGSEESVYREFGPAFRKLGIPFLGLPHGEGAVLNVLQRTDLLTFNDLPRRAAEPIYSGYLFSNRFALDQWLSVSSSNDPETMAIVGSARYSERWVNELGRLPYPKPDLPSEDSLRVVIFLIDSIYNVWGAEVERTIDAILSIQGIRLILHDHPRRYLRSDGRRHFAMTAESLAANCCLPDRVTVVSGTIPGMGLIRAADVFLSLGSSIVIEAIRLNRPALELSYLHANMTLVARELPECDIRCRDDLLIALADFVERKTKGLELDGFYNKSDRHRFLNDLLDAKHPDPLREQVGQIAKRARVPLEDSREFSRSSGSSDVDFNDTSSVVVSKFLDRRLTISLGDTWVGLPSTGENNRIILLGGPNTLEVLSDIARRVCLPDWTVWSLEQLLDPAMSQIESEFTAGEIWFSMADFPIFREFIGNNRLIPFLPKLRLVEFFTSPPPAVDRWINSLVITYGKAVGAAEPNRLRQELDLLIQLVAGRTSVGEDDRSLKALRPLQGVLGNLAFVHLAMGNLNRGWWLYEASKKRELRHGMPPFSQPMWRGETLRGRTILLWRNQGPGDEILYANAFRDIIADAERVVIEADPRLRALFERSFPEATVISRSEWPHSPEAISKVDFQAPFGSVCRHYRPTFGEFPKHNGYLRADLGRTVYWNRFLADNFPGRPVVGISWRTGSYDAEGLYQTAIEEWAPILDQACVHFVSLQYDCDSKEIDRINRLLSCSIYQVEGIDLYNELDELANLISALDLIVSIDNINSNLAGALGVPTIQLAEPWGHTRLGQSYCPFYPSVTLVPLKQNQRGAAFRFASDLIVDMARNAPIRDDK